MLIKYLSMFISSLITIVMHVFAYKTINNNKFKFNFRTIIAIIVQSILTIANTYFVMNISILSSILFSVLSLTMTYYFVYGDSIGDTFIKGVFIYFFTALYEVLLSILISKFNIISTDSFNNMILLKSVFSIIDLLFVINTLKIHFIKRIVNLICNKIKDNIKLVLIIISTIFVVFLDIKYATTINSKVYYSNLLILMCFSVILCITIYSNEKSKKSEIKIDTLLEFMEKYEKDIDNDRINRHQILNNLLMLKSYKDKNSIEYDNLINELITEYESKNIKPILNIYKLTSGLKGIVYYKVKYASLLNVEFDVHLPKNINKKLKKIDNILYNKLCKIIGILLDNSIEEASLSKLKKVLMEFYSDNNCLTILISNSCKNTVDLEKINKFKYSTKGKNRGIGLYLVNNIVKSSKEIEIKQCFNKGIFTTIIIIE